MRKHRPLHTRIPEVADVLRSGGNRLLITLCRKITSYLVHHKAQFCDIRSYSAAAGAIWRLFSDQLA